MDVGPAVVDPSKVNPKTVEAHKALQAGLVPLGKALEQGKSPTQLRELAAAKGLLVQDVLRVCSSFINPSLSFSAFAGWFFGAV